MIHFRPAPAIMKGKEHQACSRAAGVMLIVCGVPVLVVGLVLVFALKNYP